MRLKRYEKKYLSSENHVCKSDDVLLLEEYAESLWHDLRDMTDAYRLAYDAGEYIDTDRIKADRIMEFLSGDES